MASAGKHGTLGFIKSEVLSRDQHKPVLEHPSTARPQENVPQKVAGIQIKRLRLPVVQRPVLEGLEILLYMHSL